MKKTLQDTQEEYRQAIIKAIEKSSMSQNEIAKRVGTYGSLLSAWSNGKRSLKVEYQDKLAELLGVRLIVAVVE